MSDARSVADGEGRRRPVGPVEIAYRAAWRGSGHISGAHASRYDGVGGPNFDTVSLMRHPDPRRIDLLRTARDPFGGLHVRRQENRVSLTLHMLLDTSASMGFAGSAAKPALVAALAACLAASATRIGDSFSLTLCGAVVDEARSIRPSRRRGLADEVRMRLAGQWAIGASAASLVEAARRLPRRRGFVFFVSDFRLPAEEIDGVLGALSSHDVVPVDIGDPAEAEALPRWGLVELEDLETARRRLVLMRPSLRQRWIAAATSRRAEIDRICRRFGRAPFRLSGRFEPEALQRHLFEGRA